MASPAEIMRRHDEIEAAKQVRLAANHNLPEPSGFIRVDGKPMAVWLADGVTPEAIGLKTFRTTRRLTT